MIYVPILKNRKFEMQAASLLKNCFSSKIIPLFEIINDTYETQYLIDQTTGKFKTEIKPENVRATRIKLPHTDAAINTLQTINSTIDNKMAFIDYFRFTEDEYPGVKTDLQKVELSLKLSRDYNLYKKHLLALSTFENFIPVISIKQNLQIPISELLMLINDLQDKNQSIALRITSNLLDDYKIALLKLRVSDYFLIDIREQAISSQFMELNDVSDLGLYSKIILLNSPRKVSIKNPQYEERAVTTLIDNSALTEYSDYGFDGVGDYGGLKDTPPENQSGSNGKGSALALIYFFKGNHFMSLRNPDKTLGPRGYVAIKSDILANGSLFDPNGNCLVINTLRAMSGAGTFGTWKYITLSRYIYQIHSFI